MIRFLAGVAVVAAVATGLVKRHHRQQAALDAEPSDAGFAPGGGRTLPPNQAAAATPDPTGAGVTVN